MSDHAKPTKLRQIPLDLVDVPEVRVTAQYDAEHLALLKSSLAAMGTVQPIILVAHDGRYDVIDGLHRWQEAKTRGDKTIPAVVYDGSPADGLLMNLVLNRVRGKTKASEMVEVIRELTEKHGLSSDDLAAKTGLTRDYVEKLQSISRAAPSVQEALDLEVIGVGVAYELSRLPTQIQQDEMIAKHQIWRFTVRELKDFVDQVLAHMAAAQIAAPSGPPPEPPAPPHFYCEGCKAEIAPRYLRPVQVCPECFGAPYQLRQAQAAPPVENKDSAPLG